MRVVEQAFAIGFSNPVAMQLPIGAKDSFEGVVDLVLMKAIHWDEASQGTKFELKDILRKYGRQNTAATARNLEAAAESSDELMGSLLKMVTFLKIKYM